MTCATTAVSLPREYAGIESKEGQENGWLVHTQATPFGHGQLLVGITIGAGLLLPMLG